MLQSRLVEETGSTDDERRRYYRITSFGSRVLVAEAERLRRFIGAARRNGSLERIRA
jgi:predicted transcriptional regulator